MFRKYAKLAEAKQNRILTVQYQTVLVAYFSKDRDIFLDFL